MDTWDNSNKLTHPGHSPLDLQVVLFCTLSQKLNPQIWRTKIGLNFLESFQLEIQAQMFSQALFLMSTEEGQLAIIETNVVKGKLYFEQWIPSSCIVGFSLQYNMVTLAISNALDIR